LKMPGVVLVKWSVLVVGWIPGSLGSSTEPSQAHMVISKWMATAIKIFNQSIKRNFQDMIKAIDTLITNHM
jgi:hypothetical protein